MEKDKKLEIRFNISEKKKKQLQEEAKDFDLPLTTYIKLRLNRKIK